MGIKWGSHKKVEIFELCGVKIVSKRTRVKIGIFWVMKIEWWKLSDEKVLTKQGLNHFRQYLSLWPFLIEIGPHGSAKKKMLPFETWYGPTGSERSLIQCWQLTTTIFPYTFYCMNFCYYLFFIKNVTSSWSKAIITLERHTATLNSCDCPIHY